MSAVGLERVLVVPTELFHELGYFQGFCTDVDKYLPTLLDPAHTSYRPRNEMESDPSFKQLIPYVIFRYESADGIQLFQYTRGSGQGEVRLHARKSVGIGGHISTDDDDTTCVYESGMQRELDEETIINTEYAARQIGMINDDETDVGKVHLGVVHIFDVREPAVEARESEIVDAGFWPVDRIMNELDRYESWSQICLQALFG
ncbi:MAG: phosphoesterase [Pirellulaceae bacterium]